MRKITIGFSKPKGKIFPIFSWLIRLYQGTKYSHVYITWETLAGTKVCYHAAGKMLHFLGEEAMNADLIPIETYDFEIEEEHFKTFVNYCFKYAGAPYALLEVFKIPLYRLGLLKKEKDNPNKQYCAELVARCLHSLTGEEVFDDYDTVTVVDVHDYVKKKFDNGKISS